MEIRPTRLPGLALLAPQVHGDRRGFFVETSRDDELAALGLGPFVQDNHSRSVSGVLRGMHLQVGDGQAKLVRCARGAILDVVVDIRRGSPTFGRWEGHRLDDETHLQLYVPVGFAHGFYVLSDVADVVYRCSSYYEPALERSIAYDDPDIGIDWPAGSPVVSDRDAAAPRLADVARDLPFEYSA